jgi:hypothetical protein
MLNFDLALFQHLPLKFLFPGLARLVTTRDGDATEPSAPVSPSRLAASPTTPQVPKPPVAPRAYEDIRTLAATATHIDTNATTWLQCTTPTLKVSGRSHSEKSLTNALEHWHHANYMPPSPGLISFRSRSHPYTRLEIHNTIP